MSISKPRSSLATELARIYRPLVGPRAKKGLDDSPHGPWLRDGLLALARESEGQSVGHSPASGVKRRSSPGGAKGLVVPGQPGDAALLVLSPIYRRARIEFLKGGGSFLPSLVSTPRTLSSDILLTQQIEYSPIERELTWLAQEARNAKRPGDFKALLELRTYTSSVFHEQSHRRLWRWMPPPARFPSKRGRDALRRYLNLVESLVVVGDMALGDELTPEVVAPFYLSGAVYARGTPVRAACANRREYRNYLQACVHATYLVLEQYDFGGIDRAVEALFPALGDLGTRAVNRACRLDPGFIWVTNPMWQEKHEKAVRRELSKFKGAPLELPADPLDNRLAYLLGERWLNELGL